ncbi:MAG: hypothetical protein A2173_08695 [Planctomycetes bacterium RBG_13_44_8b]|nr:MAG: hypothetical protein A2173_08695 [Planctomycetes bacterium RBG_13_44_8b]
MHNEIMQPQAGLIIDHKDHNGLNNSRANLRPATKAQNCWNRRKKPGCSSKYKGVCFNKALGKWAGSIRFEGRRSHLGYFVNEEEAARTYDAAARKYHGEFAALNFK